MTQTEYETWSQPYRPTVAPTAADASFHPQPAPYPPSAPSPQPYPQPYAQPYTQPYPPSQRRLGALGLGTAFLGATAVFASFVGLPWFDDGTVYAYNDRSGSFSVIRTVIERIQINPDVTVEPVAVHYFSWLSWALLLACGGAAVVANLPTRAAGAFRTVGLLVSLVAVGLTFWAIDLLSVHGGPVPDPGYGTYFGATSVGFWAAVGGFALMGVGSLIGARRAPAPTPAWG